MQAIDETVQTIAKVSEILSLLVPAGIRVETRSLPRSVQLFKYVSLACLIGVQLKAEAAKTDILQTVEDHVERGGLLGYKEYGLPLAQQVRDEIGDRLALAGTGGPTITKSLPLSAVAIAAICEESAGNGVRRSEGL